MFYLSFHRRSAYIDVQTIGVKVGIKIAFHWMMIAVHVLLDHVLYFVLKLVCATRLRRNSCVDFGWKTWLDAIHRSASNGCAIVICANSVKLELIVKCSIASKRSHFARQIKWKGRWRGREQNKKGKSFIRQWRSCVVLLPLKPDLRHPNSS